MIDQLQKTTEERMHKTVEATRSELATLRTGKASPALLDVVKVDYYGSSVPLKQVANVTAPEARLLVIQPWDKNLLHEIEKAILKSELGITPTNDGQVIRLPIPPLTEERRKDLVKLAHKIAENGRVAVRNIRRDAIEKLKKAEKDHQIPEDDSKRAQEKVQQTTDKYIKQIDEILHKKEQEIMEV